MEMRACVVDDFGMVPNRLGASKTAGPTYFRTTNSSATSGRGDVGGMGLMSLNTFVTGFRFGKGVTSAYFHDRGNSCSANEQFKIEQIGLARK